MARLAMMPPLTTTRMPARESEATPMPSTVKPTAKPKPASALIIAPAAALSNRGRSRLSSSGLIRPAQPAIQSRASMPSARRRSRHRPNSSRNSAAQGSTANSRPNSSLNRNGSGSP